MSDPSTATSRALEVAQFLDTRPVGSSAEEIMRAVAARWPELRKEDYLQALDIAIEACALPSRPTPGLAA